MKKSLIRNTDPDNTKNRLRIFTKSNYRNGKPIEADLKFYRHKIVYRDLSEEQTQLLQLVYKAGLNPEPQSLIIPGREEQVYIYWER